MGKKRTDPNWTKLREALWTRSEGCCEVSGRPLDPETFDAHHRRLRGMGGTYRPLTDSLCNLLALDPEVHNGAPWSVHQRSAWSRPRGLLLSASVDDKRLVDTPLLYREQTWAHLTIEGDVAPMSIAAQEKMWVILGEWQARAQPPRGSQYRWTSDAES